MKMLKLLRLPHIRLLWGSQVFSSWGDQLFLLAITWVAVQQVGSAVGIVIGVGSACALLMGIFGGALVDRWNTRITMITVDSIRAVAVLSLPIFAFLTGLQLWYLVVVNAVVETLDMLFDPALQVSLPFLISEPNELHAANSLLDASRRLSRILGPGLAGVLLLFIPIIHFFTIDALSFLISAGAIFLVGNHFAWKTSQRHIEKHQARGFFAEIVSAFQAVGQSQPILWTFITMGVSNIAWGASFIVGVPLLASRVFHTNTTIYGLVIAAFGIGNILSTLWVGNLFIRHPIRFMFIGRIALSIGYLLIAAAGNIWIVFVGAVIAALGGPMGSLPLLAIIQTQFPSDSVGKISSLRSTLSALGLTFGVFLATPMFLFFNVRVAIAVFPLGGLILSLYGLVRFFELSPGLRREATQP